VLPRMICAPASTRFSGVMALTVAWVPTGMKTGVEGAVQGGDLAAAGRALARPAMKTYRARTGFMGRTVPNRVGTYCTSTMVTWKCSDLAGEGMVEIHRGGGFARAVTTPGVPALGADRGDLCARRHVLRGQLFQRYLDEGVLDHRAVAVLGRDAARWRCPRRNPSRAFSRPAMSCLVPCV
jgi:hypothetical protein